VKLGRRLTLIVYVVCALAVIEGLAWVTWQAMRLERREREARAEAAHQESIRLALWRMDSILIPLISREDGTPYFHYRSFYSEQQAYNAMYQPLPPDAILVPSPLLVDSGEFALLHFEIDGELTSPEAPTGNMRDEAEAHYVSSERVIEAEARLDRLERMLGADAGAFLRSRAPIDDELVEFDDGSDRADTSAPAQQSLEEFKARQQVADLAREAVEGVERLLQADDRALTLDEIEASAGTRLGLPPEAPRVRRTQMTPVWVRDDGAVELLLVREVALGDREAIQGVWLDWQALSERLLEAVGDVAPDAALRPVIQERAARAHMLASVPAILETPAPGAPPGLAWSPTRITLVVTWIAVLGAVGAIGLVLRASIRLSERRGRFVSAVTHELRTPLTTFCLYTDMLAQGMVGDETARRDYLQTLRRESQRLARIVENVLMYARIGSAPRPKRAAPVTVDALLERTRPLLEARAAQDDFELDVDLEPGAGDLRVAADADVVERILMNLVDNACKYAADATDRRLELGVRRERREVVIRFRDHGPGVRGADRHAIFGAFARGRRVEAVPGLGLGLALARALAREMGGDLRLAGAEGPGAAFELTVALADEPPG